MFTVRFTHISVVLLNVVTELTELVNGKRRVKPLEDAAFKKFKKFKGSCIVRIVHTFSGKTKGITICADEILKYSSKNSYFHEYPEE